MFRRADAVLVVDDSGAEAQSPGPAHRPDIAGALAGLLTNAPCFRTRVRGYDRLEVDNYVAWAEAELSAAQRETDDLLTRYAQVAAEVEISRRLLAQSPEGQEATLVSERMGRMLRTAADEAAEITAAASAEADKILSEARADADARLRKAHEIKQVAVDAADRIREDAERLRAEAAAELDRAREQAAQSLRDAAEQIQREQQAAAEATAARLAGLQDEAQKLCHRRDQAREHLRLLTHQVGEALDALAENYPVDPPAEPAPNFVVDRAPVRS
jgi:cell division septum initiation protein DivIVA